MACTWASRASRRFQASSWGLETSEGSPGRNGWVIGAHQGNKQVGGGDRALGGKKGVQDRLEGAPRPKLETCSAVRATSGGYGSITQLAEGDPKYIQYCTVSTSITTHLAEGDPKRTSLRNPYARVDASEGSEAWEGTVQYT